MINQKKLQSGRAWGYLAGIVLFLAVVSWKYMIR